VKRLDDGSPGVCSVVMVGRGGVNEGNAIVLTPTGKDKGGQGSCKLTKLVEALWYG